MYYINLQAQQIPRKQDESTSPTTDPTKQHFNALGVALHARWRWYIKKSILLTIAHGEWELNAPPNVCAPILPFCGPSCFSSFLAPSPSWSFSHHHSFACILSVITDLPQTPCSERKETWGKKIKQTAAPYCTWPNLTTKAKAPDSMKWINSRPEINTKDRQFFFFFFRYIVNRGWVSPNFRHDDRSWKIKPLDSFKTQLIALLWNVAYSSRKKSPLLPRGYPKSNAHTHPSLGILLFFALVQGMQACVHYRDAM